MLFAKPIVVTLALLTFAPVDFCAAAAETTSCESNTLRVSPRGCWAQELFDVEYRDIGKEIAYDHLLRNDSRSHWDTREMDRLAKDFNLIAQALRLYTSTVDLGYQVRVLELKLDAELRSELGRVVAPGFRKDPRRALPERFSEFEEATRKLCVQCIYAPRAASPEAPPSPAFALLAPEVNPLYAARTLRSISGVAAAGLSKIEASQERSVRIATNALGDVTYFRATAGSTTQYVMSTPNTLRYIPESEIGSMPGFRFRELPAEAWLPSTQATQVP